MSWLQVLPVFPTDSSLPQDAGKQVYTNIAAMGIWDYQLQLPVDHVLVSTSRVWAFKSNESKIGYQVISANRAEGRH